jgi:hypothetical protein
MGRRDQRQQTTRGDGPWFVIFLILLAAGAKPAADTAAHQHKPRHRSPAALAKMATPPLGPASGDVVRLALAQATRMRASRKVTLALIEAGIVESNLRNLPYGDRDSLGYLQQRPSKGWRCPMNITCATWDFLRRAIPAEHRYGTSGQLAQAVQRSAFPLRYDQRQAEAEQVIASYQAGGGDS